jgi:hypothetical protein
MPIALTTPQHEKLSTILSDETKKQEARHNQEMSVRPLIHRAVLAVLEENPEDVHGDLKLMRDITGHDPTNKEGYPAYDANLRRLSALMDTPDNLYGGEYEWTRIILGLK